MYQKHGFRERDECGLLAEVMADVGALLVIGPHYVYSLFLATVGLAALPAAPGDEPPEEQKHLGGVEVSPMVRLGVLFACVKQLKKGWPDGPVGFYAEPRLGPVEAVYGAYFRLLRERGEGQWDHESRLTAFREEIEILHQGVRQHRQVVPGALGGQPVPPHPGARRR